MKKIDVPCAVGDRCLVSWNDGKQYVAIVTEIKISNDSGFEFKARSDNGGTFSFEEREIGNTVSICD